MTVTDRHAYLPTTPTRPAQVPKLRCTALHTVAHTTPRPESKSSKEKTAAAAMVEGGSGAGAPSCRSVVGPAARRCCGCGLGRLVRRLRRQGRQALCAAARPSAASSSSAAALRVCQYDPLSYARNFDHTGFGDPDPDADAASSSLYYSYTFSSRFVLAPSTATSTSSSVAAAVVVAAPAGLVVATRPTAATH